jgi:hypothetical protein
MTDTIQIRTVHENGRLNLMNGPETLMNGPVHMNSDLRQRFDALRARAADIRGYL